MTGGLSVSGEVWWSWGEVKGLEEVHHLTGKCDSHEGGVKGIKK